VTLARRLARLALPLDSLADVSALMRACRA